MDGQIKMIKQVMVGNAIDSYLSEGISGNFHIMKLSKKNLLLFAFDNEENKVYDSEEIESLRKGVRKTGFAYLFCLLLLSFFSILLILGWVLFPVALFVTIKSFQSASKLDNDRLKKYLHYKNKKYLKSVTTTLKSSTEDESSHGIYENIDEFVQYKRIPKEKILKMIKQGYYETKYENGKYYIHECEFF